MVDRIQRHPTSAAGKRHRAGLTCANPAEIGFRRPQVIKTRVMLMMKGLNERKLRGGGRRR